MFRCVVCHEKAEYLIIGSSYCREHAEAKNKQMTDIQEELKKRSKSDEE